jgi:hypothetical protein
VRREIYFVITEHRVYGLANLGAAESLADAVFQSLNAKGLLNVDHSGDE